jgi:hypothetical protein
LIETLTGMSCRIAFRNLNFMCLNHSTNYRTNMTRSKIKTSMAAACILLFCPVFLLKAQKKSRSEPSKQIAMMAEYWEVKTGKVEFVQYKNVPIIKLQPDAGLAIVKGLDFINGTIEFDAEPLDAATAPFVTCYFRLTSDGESEVFYLRLGREENHKRNDAVQYAPLIKTVNLWDMLPQYQGPAVLENRNWNHIKIIVSGAQMRAYVNDMNRPALEVPFLESNSSHGSIAFEGLAAFANLVIKTDIVEGLPANKGVDLTDHDANYVRKWFVTQPAILESGRELTQQDFPIADAIWEPLSAERNGLINLTRKFGVENRRYVWLKTTIQSASELQKRIQLGFSDEVWVFVNRRLIYVDKNLYLQGMRKTPNGRCSIENSSFNFSLKPGDNEILIGVANDFYGWGIIARIESLDGIELLR